MKLSRQQVWNLNNPDSTKQSVAKYNAKRPAFTFRPTPEMLVWLESERLEGENNATLLKRLMWRLMEPTS